MIKIISSLVALGLISTWALAAPDISAPQLTLVSEGKTRCAIVLPHDFTSPMEFAANDLSRHLGLMSGADVPVYKQSNAADLPTDFDGLILITHQPAEGETPLASEEYKITSQPGKPWTIRIFGDGKRGAMYGTYGLLQDVLGCRWFTATSSRIPKQKTISVAPLAIHQKPSFEYREPYYWEAFTNREWVVHNRVNGSNGHVDDSVGGKVKYGPGAFVHTMLNLVKPSEYFQSHPEYFALVRGERVSNTQLCLTNPDVLKLVIAGVKQWIQESPDSEIFSVSQMDNEGGACQCENCAKVLKEEGAESGPILRFVNAVAAEIGKEYPHVKIDTLAYNYSQSPPKKAVPLPNVRIRLCIAWGCKAHSMTSACNEATLRDILTWGKIAPQLYIWDYDTEYNDLLMLHPSFNYLKSVFSTLSKDGVIGNFMLGSYVSPGGCLAEMKAYLCARLTWDATQDPDVVLSEYIEGVYGRSAPIIKEWIALMQSPFKGTEGTVEKDMGIYDLPDSFYLNKEIMDGSDKLMEQAVAASKDDPSVLNEIRKIQMWIDYTRIAQIKLKPEVKGEMYQYGVTDHDLERIDRWLASKDHFKVTRLAEAYIFNDAEMLTSQNAKLAAYTLDNNRLSVDIVPELGGKIVRLFDKKAKMDLMLPTSSPFKRTGGGFDQFFVAEKGGVESPDFSEFHKTKYEVSKAANAVTLQGLSPEGRAVTREYRLDGNALVLKTTVKNTTAQPLDAKVWTRPLFPFTSFEDMEISFKTVGGETVELQAKDFSINWNELSKKYTDARLPAGEIHVRLKKSKFSIQSDSAALEMFHVWNQGGLLAPRWLDLGFHGKAVTLQPDESTTFEQRWVFQ